MAQDKTKQQQPAASGGKVVPGGYHSRGVPGEEAELRKHMRLVKLKNETRYIRKSRPLKGGRTAESTSADRLEATATTGERAVYVLAETGDDQLTTPVFYADESGMGEAVAVFTDKPHAVRYLQTADWSDKYDPATLSPSDLANWLKEVREDGITYVTVNPDRHSHLRGESQPVLMIGELVDHTPEALYREVAAIAERNP